MRTAQRDQGGTINFNASVTDAASGSGVAQPGAIPFVFTRTSTGVYQLRFDSRISVIAAVANPASGGYMTQAPGGNMGAGTVQANLTSNTFTGVNGNFSVLCTALDKRT